jgi:hypothetical protein
MRIQKYVYLTDTDATILLRQIKKTYQYGSDLFPSPGITTAGKYHHIAAVLVTIQRSALSVQILNTTARNDLKFTVGNKNDNILRPKLLPYEELSFCLFSSVIPTTT